MSNLKTKFVKSTKIACSLLFTVFLLSITTAVWFKTALSWLVGEVTNGELCLNTFLGILIMLFMLTVNNIIMKRVIKGN